MKIAIWHNLAGGGAKRALHDQVTGLLDRGHDVEVWRPPTADDSFLPLADLAPVRVVPWERRSETSTARVRRQLRYGTHPDRTALATHWARCAREMEAQACDVVLATTCRRYFASGIGGHTALPSVLYLQEPNRRLVEAWPHGLWAAPRASEHRVPGIRELWRQLEQAVVLREARLSLRTDAQWLAGFDQVLVNSQFSRESVFRAYGIEARVCLLGVDLNRFRPGHHPREGFTLGVGAVVPAKRIDLAVRALALLPPPLRRLVWVGNSADQGHATWLRSLAADHQVDLDLRVLVDDHALVDLLQRATLLLATSRLEPFGYAPVEAQACGTPVVALDEGGFRESVQHRRTGILVGPSAAEVAAAVHELYEGSERGEAMGRAGRQHVVEQFGLETASRRLEKELQQVLERAS